MTKNRLIVLCVILFFVPIISTFAQSPASVKQYVGVGVEGYEDGNKDSAQFHSPAYATMDASGTIYVTDSRNHLIRKISRNGEVSTVAGKVSNKDAYGEYVGGFIDGPAETAQFYEPQGIAVTNQGVLYVADSKNGAIRKIENGNVTTIVEDLQLPTGLVLGNNGELYVSETLNHRIIKITNESNITVVAGNINSGLQDGVGTAARFNEPTGLAISENGTLYVADSANQRIRSITPNGEVKTIAGSGNHTIDGTNYIVGGYVNGESLQAKFNFPHGIHVSSDGTIYVADTLNHVIRKITPAGNVSTVAGTTEPGNLNYTESKSAFDRPTDVFVLPSGDLGVVDHWNHSLRLIEWYRLPSEVNNMKNVHVVWNDQIVHFDVQPMIKNGRTMLPIRQLAQGFGYQVYWNKNEQVVTFINEDKTIEMKIGSKLITGDVNMEMDTEPSIVNGRTLVPLRFVAEAFDKDVKWIDRTKTVLIR